MFIKKKKYCFTHWPSRAPYLVVNVIPLHKASVRVNRTTLYVCYHLTHTYNLTDQLNSVDKYLGRLGCREVKPGRDKVMLRHLGPVFLVSGLRHQTSWPGSNHRNNNQRNKNRIKHFPQHTVPPSVVTRVVVRSLIWQFWNQLQPNLRSDDSVVSNSEAASVDGCPTAAPL